MFRDRNLTPDEVAVDAELRRKIEAEFPPAKSTDGSSSSLSELLKRSIRTSSKSVGDITAAAEVPESLITRFLSGERDIHVRTADKLADVLGLKIASD